MLNLCLKTNALWGFERNEMDLYLNIAQGVWRIL